MASKKGPAAAPPSPSKPAVVKVVLLGEAAVGKSSIVLRFAANEFQENREPTIGAAFLARKVDVGNRSIKFEIWDTAGQERFNSLAPMYYRNAQAAIVAYDITNENSWKRAQSWIRELQRQANANIVIALAGNKCDLADMRAVRREDVQSFATDANLLFLETSAKNDINIHQLFQAIAERLPQDIGATGGREKRKDVDVTATGGNGNGGGGCAC